MMFKFEIIDETKEKKKRYEIEEAREKEDFVPYETVDEKEIYQEDMPVKEKGANLKRESVHNEKRRKQGRRSKGTAVLVVCIIFLIIEIILLSADIILATKYNRGLFEWNGFKLPWSKTEDADNEGSKTENENKTENGNKNTNNANNSTNNNDTNNTDNRPTVTPTPEGNETIDSFYDIETHEYREKHYKNGILQEELVFNVLNSEEGNPVNDLLYMISYVYTKDDLVIATTRDYLGEITEVSATYPTGEKYKDVYVNGDVIHSFDEETGICRVCGEKDNYTWIEYVNEFGIYRVNGPMRYTDVYCEIPAFYDDGVNGRHEVGIIAEGAFSNALVLKKLIIPETICYIGEGALTDIDAECIVYSNGNTGDMVLFYFMENLKNVKYKVVTPFEYRVYRNTENVILTSYDEHFSGEEGIVTIPDMIDGLSVIDIDKNIFVNCNHITKIRIPYDLYLRCGKWLDNIAEVEYLNIEG